MAKASSVKKATVAAGNRKTAQSAAPAKPQKPVSAGTSKTSGSVAPAKKTTGKQSAPVTTTASAKKKTATPVATTKKTGAATAKTTAAPAAKKNPGAKAAGTTKQTVSKTTKQSSAAPASKTATAKKAVDAAAKKTTGTAAKKTSATKQIPVPDPLSSSTSRQGTGIMAKEKPTKASAKTEKTSGTTKTTADKKSTAKSASAASSGTTSQSAKTATKITDAPAVEAHKKPVEPVATAVVEPGETIDTDRQEPVTDLLDDMTTVSTTGEVAADADLAATTAEQNIAGEEAARRRQRPKVQYSEAELEEFRATIEKTREEAVEEFQILRQNLEDITNSELADENASYSMHMAEQGTEAQEKEKIYAQVQRLNDYIKKLDEALQRIKDQTYGICRVCGILIAKERLLAVPITTLSASYKIQKKCPDDGIDRIIAPK